MKNAFVTFFLIIFLVCFSLILVLPFFFYSYRYAALLQLQQDLSWEDTALQGPLMLQSEEQQSLWELPRGGRGAVRSRAASSQR